jgi:hypothetical protein
MRETINNKDETCDGLVSLFLDLANGNSKYEQVDYIRSWKAGLIKALSELKSEARQITLAKSG